MSEQRSELIKLFGSLHNAINKKPWDQTEVSGCLLDITTKFDYDDAKVKSLEAKLQVAELAFLKLKLIKTSQADGQNIIDEALEKIKAK
jgi:hypothetical protein